MQELQLIPKKAALFNIHFPKRRSFGESPIRLKFEELFFIQLQCHQKSVQKTQNKGTSFFCVGDNCDFYQNHLPLSSPAQKG
jgi:ATP-dependent DNA helicase RecG